MWVPVRNAYWNEPPFSGGSIYREYRYDTGRIWHESDLARARYDNRYTDRHTRVGAALGA